MQTNTKKLDGKVAIVTGASKGIGTAIAKHLAAEGAAVVVNYSSSKEGADRVVDEITKQGGKAVAVRANMAKKAEVERLFSEAKKAFGRLDILVNNAGVYEFLPLENVTGGTFPQTLRRECSRFAFSNPRSNEVLRSRRRKCNQHQL